MIDFGLCGAALIAALIIFSISATVIGYLLTAFGFASTAVDVLMESLYVIYYFLIGKPREERPKRADYSIKQSKDAKSEEKE